MNIKLVEQKTMCKENNKEHWSTAEGTLQSPVAFLIEEGNQILKHNVLQV